MKKKRFLCWMLSATYSRGINAIKIKKVNGDSGHAAHKRMPDKKTSKYAVEFFKQVIFTGSKVGNNYEVRIT